MLNLRSALQLRLRGRAATPEQIQAIVDALDAAAKAIERAWNGEGRIGETTGLRGGAGLPISGSCACNP